GAGLPDVSEAHIESALRHRGQARRHSGQDELVAGLRSRYESQCCGIHAVPEVSGSRPVVEHMAEMAVTAGTRYLGPPSKAEIDARRDVFLGDRRPVTWPASARIELRLGIEQCRPAADTTVQAVGVVVVVLAGERALG